MPHPFNGPGVCTRRVWLGLSLSLSFALSFTLAFTLGAVAPAARAQAAPAAAATSAMPSLAPMLTRITPGVVGISVVQQREQDNPLANDPAFRRFFEEREGGSRRPGQPAPPQQQEARPAGSGTVIDAEQGLVMTNHHVVQGASRVVVVIKDRREFDARVLGSDPGTDVALLKITATNLTAVTWGDSDRVQVGDYVVAIGNPFGGGHRLGPGPRHFT
jgi:serine protease DegQ